MVTAGYVARIVVLGLFDVIPTMSNTKVFMAGQWLRKKLIQYSLPRKTEVLQSFHRRSGP
ncbi:hypothetical protein BZK31_22290 [Pseudomonas floridensis]|uniref:Uncharacterized protein n=1 Tax=Pseudomonas floridensis TaxID=1958950 RepID=A0A1X0N244_9PSED|nr:hypothetical protein BZK31_22290 [Pseudomonas floridensis]